MIIAVFLFTFILPLMVFKVPLQGDDLSYYKMLYGNKTKLADFYEFQRLPLEGATLFYSYKLLIQQVNEPSENLILFIYYLFHLLSAIMLYYFSAQLVLYLKTRMRTDQLTAYDDQLPILAALLFLVMPIALDSYANISLTVRNIALPLILGCLILKLKYISSEKASPGLLIGSIFLLLAAISYYESYILYLFFGWGLLVLGKNLDLRIIKAQTIELLTIILLMSIKFMFGMNNMVSRGMNSNLMHLAKSILLYCISIVLPHIHGLMLWTSPLYLLAMIYLVVILIRQLLAGRREIWFLALLIACYLLGISFNPYIILRALYGIMPLIAILGALLILKQPKIMIIVGLSGMIIFASVVALWQFYYLQDRTYNEVAALIKKVDALDSSRPQSLVYRTSSLGVRWLLIYDDLKINLAELPYNEIFKKDYSNISLTVKLNKKDINTKTGDPKKLINNMIEMLKSNWLGN